MKPLIVEEENGGIICYRDGDTGMHVEGRGSSVLEAIGSWCLYSGLIKARCDPPQLLETRFSTVDVLTFEGAPKR